MRTPTPLRTRMLLGGSLLCLTISSAGPARAQLAAIRAAAGTALPTLPSTAIPGPGANLGPISLIHDQTSATARQAAVQQRFANSVGMVNQAQAAARAAAASLSSVIPNGLAKGGLDLALNPLPAAQDPTGLHTLQGALVPTQTVAGSATTVTVTQTGPRAILSWTTFNVGQNTTINFSQRVGGVVQKDWVAFNRVVGQYDPLTGRRDPSLAPAPSQILGHVTADASVIVINANGVFFGPNAQVNAGSLLVSTEEFGNPTVLLGTTAGQTSVRPSTIAERNVQFLRAGVLSSGDASAPFAQFGPAQVQTVTLTPGGDQISSSATERAVEGDIQISAGAQLAVGDAGLLFAVAPHIVNAGSLNASNGEIGLVAGRVGTLTATGVASNPDVRGLIFTANSAPADGSDFYVENTGLISSPRGYLSLQAGRGAILQQGVLEATTSVARNGFIDLGAADVQLAAGSTIAVTPDGDGSTVPQSPSSVAAFKTSRVRVAGALTTSGSVGGSRIEVGAGSLVYAPGGRADIGASSGIDAPSPDGASSRVFIDAGATIDVGGIKDFQVPASRNQVTIAPVKGNELRDTPNYRQSFLNGATIYVDPRRSGVRADGVAWVGSPLIEAGSYYQDIGVTAAELLTKGGQITLGTSGYTGVTPNPNSAKPALVVASALAPDVIVKPGAVLDMSGGWVTYQAGPVQTSQLITAGGQTVDVGDADPNAVYVGLVNPFTTRNTRFGITDKYVNGALQGVTQAAQYSEGRDAGSLIVNAPAIALDGTLYGAAYAGAQQRANAVVGTATVAGDPRALQSVPSQLPQGALLVVGPLLQGVPPTTGDILVTKGAVIPALPGNLAYGQSVSIAADGTLVRTPRDVATLLDPARRDTIQLADSALSGADLGGLILNTSGSLTFAKGTVTTLAPGGVLGATTGRAILIDGKISVPGGAIVLATVGSAGILTAQSPVGGSVFAPSAPQAGAFDVTVNGTLSTRGRFIDDLGSVSDTADGAGYARGGSVSIFAAPDISTSVGAPKNAALDISGSILVNSGALIDVSGGALVSATGAVSTSARGGNVTLLEETTYAQLLNDYATQAFLEVRGLRFTPPGSILATTGVTALNPAAITARVLIAPGTIRAHGFAGGGTFTLTTPSFAFGDSPSTTGTTLPLNFLEQTGFGAANITVFKTSLTPNLFNNGLGGFNAVLATNTLTVAAGQTLSLTQSQFSPILTTDETLALQAAGSGTDLYTLLTPIVPIAAFDQKPIALKFGGLVEVDVATQGRIEGAGGASLSAAKLFDQGVIRLPGGGVTANETLPAIYSQPTSDAAPLFVTSADQPFSIGANGKIDENAPNAFGVVNGQGKLISNRDLALARPLIIIGQVSGRDGIVIGPGGTLDVSGVSLRNPRAVGPTGAIIDGNLLGGGTIASLPLLAQSGPIFSARNGLNGIAGLNASARAGLAVDFQPGSTIDISGASDSFARPDATGVLVPTLQWSNAGTLALEGGTLAARGAGTFAGATILAHGGAPGATGGTLVVLDPVLAQVDDPGRATNIVSADAVQKAGFSTFVAEGSLGTAGPVNLTLDRAFVAQSRSFLNDGTNNEAVYGLRVGATGDLTLTAPIIRLASIAQTVPDNTLGVTGAATVRLNAAALDVQGAVLFDRSIGSVTLSATQDLRLVGVQPLVTTLGTGQATPSLAGQLLVGGDLTLKAAQVYPTTGTSFTVASSGPTSTITLQAAGATPATPYSAGSNLLVQAADIEQDGVLRAPLGTLTLGSNTPLLYTNSGGIVFTLSPATGTLHLGTGSITSVSADGLSIPYGVTTDAQEYFFTPTVAAQLSAPPAALLQLRGAKIALDKGATVDLQGGGDVFAFEFVPGTGGSRDVLSRFNSDPFSANKGLQYADGRQVYAIVPAMSQPGLAFIDPIYSADYQTLTSASQVGRQVYLNASPGLAAGWYTLLPAHYALLPGGLRVVEQPEYGTALPGASAQLLDGTTVVGGYYGTAGTGLHESALRSFAVQTQATFRKASQIATTSADLVFPARAARDGLASPRVPLDAGKLVLAAITGITADATFATDPAKGGRAASTDIGGSAFLITGAPPVNAAPAGTIVLTTATLQSLNSASLLIGGTRTDNVDGTTNVIVNAKTITVANDAATPLNAPELLFAVDGSGSSITITDGATITASGASGDTRTGDYLLTGTTTANGNTGAGAFVRFSTGPERLATRTGVQPDAVAPTLHVGLAHLSAPSLLLDSSAGLTIASPTAGTADIAATHIAVDAGAVAFTDKPLATGLGITPALQATFARAATLTVRSPQAVSFAGGTYGFGALTLDTPGLASLDGGNVTLTTAALRLQNSAAALGTCAPACGTAAFGVTASSISFGSGQIRALGFGGGTSFTAPGGITFDGTDKSIIIVPADIANKIPAITNGLASFDAGSGALTLATPFLGDRALPLTPGQSAVLPRLALTTTGALRLTGIAGAVAPAVAGTPGARLALSGEAIAITDTQVVATAGVLDVAATNGIVLAGTASLATPGYSKVLGDKADPVTLTAPGGFLTLTAGNGAIDLGQNTRLSVGGGTGRSGSLTLVAANGQVDANGTIDATTPGGGGMFTLVSRGVFDLGRFAASSANGFTSGIDIRSGAGDLALAQGQALKSSEVRLTADGGATMIAGTIDTSGINGGAISLYGGSGVTLASTGRLLARASGYGVTDSRQARGGDVTLGTDGAGAITLAAGSLIDVSAARPGDRLVADVRGGITYYRLAAGDTGGTLSLRAPIVAASGGDSVNAGAAGTVVGARDVRVEAFRRFDLGAVSANPGFTGVSLAGGTVVLDPGATAGVGQVNFLADLAPGTIPGFIQAFDISAAAPKLGGIGAYRTLPGIELDYSGNVQVGTLTTDPASGLVRASNWNLGAGTVDIAGAVAAGLAADNPANPGQFAILPGSEAQVFARFTSLLYRVGGKVTGAAPALAIRAGGNLDIKGSITDGFFAFRDQTTPEAINLAFGGGMRAGRPAAQPNCPGGDCSRVVGFSATSKPSPTANNAITIDFSASGPGFALGSSPTAPIAYNAAANSAAAPSGGPDGSGDPLGTAQVFPTLPGGGIVRSASYTLVGGADLAAYSGRPSVDPGAINPASHGQVIIEGETSYAVSPAPGPSIFRGNLQVENDISTAQGNTAFAPLDFVGQFVANEGNALGQNPKSAADLTLSTTTITLQDPNGPTDQGSKFLVVQAASFFTDPRQAVFATNRSGVRTVTTTLALAGQFLNQIAPGYGRLLAAPGVAGLTATGDALPTSVLTSAPAQPTNFVRTRVRTGTGSVAVAAAGDIDMRSLDPATGAALLRPSDGSNDLLQVGGTSIYTVGTIASLTPHGAADPSNGTQRMVNPGAYAQTNSVFADPNASLTPLVDALANDPLYLENGGNVSLRAGGSVLGQRDVAGGYRPTYVSGFSSTSVISSVLVGSSDQPYRFGQVGMTTDIRVIPQLFQTGIGTLGGGNVSVRAGHDVSDLTIVANTSVVTAGVSGGGVAPTRALVTVGGGDVSVLAGRDIASGLYDIGEGALAARVGRDIASTGTVIIPGVIGSPPLSNALRIRVADSTVTLAAGGAITLHDVSAFAPSGAAAVTGPAALQDASLNFYMPVAAVSAASNAAIAIENYGEELPAYANKSNGIFTVLPGTIDLTSTTGDLNLAAFGANGVFLSPSPAGQLRLLAGGNLRPVVIDMDDSDPGMLPGYFGSLDDTTAGTRSFVFPIVLSGTSDTIRRSYHNASGATHAGDAQPARIAVGGDIQQLVLNTPKQTRVSAGRDVLNAAVFMQNLAPGDVSRVAAGRDIIATSAVGQAYNGGPVRTGNVLPYAQGNTFVVGGPGAFYLDAGRDAGPFLTSAVSTAGTQNSNSPAGAPAYATAQTTGGGVLSVGNEWNPYLAPTGANVTVSFGVAGGVNYAGFADTYLNPANIAALPDDQFVQTIDQFSRSVADRSRPIYAPVLVRWVQAHAAAEALAAFGTTDLSAAQAYAVYVALEPLRQRQLVQQVYFSELTQTSIPTSVSYLKYSRGYRAVNLLFPPADGYTANNLSGGGNSGTVPIQTGNLDLRLATIQTARGGDVTIFGPGGRVLGGSTVSTAQQAARRLTNAESVYAGGKTSGFELAAITSIPTGLEGVITLRGGAINGFVDQNFLLNQSRVFTEAGGNVALWSSNGDLNAGQGPKTSANFPPVVVRVGPNANAEVDAVGGVTGAGIAAFQPAPGTPPPDVFLIAPRGTVDAGDAGVRVAGNLFVAALAVANADNFTVGGQAFGIPSGPVVNVAAAAAGNAASAAGVQAADAASREGQRRRIDPLSRIVVDVLGYYGQDPCAGSQRPPECPAPGR